MSKPLPLGISDYKNIIDRNYYYIDKTLLIKELEEVGGGVTLLCRPRRFGKTLNLSMLRYFFEKTDTDTSYLFKDKAIWQHEEYHTLQGHSPVIYITFKDVKDKSWAKAYAKIAALIAAEYERHENFIETNKHLISQKSYDTFRTILSEQANDTQAGNSLHLLCHILSSITNTKVILLIDEYDSPIHAAYSNNYYDKIIEFMRDLLSSALKDNAYLYRAVLTGILRTAKEGIFSGLNNLEVYTILDEPFSDKFGFTHQEVDALLADYNLLSETETIKQWYNGYHAGQIWIYNPWSLLKSVKDKGLLKTYWVNTSDNLFIRQLIARAPESVKKDFEQLLTGVPCTALINDAFTFANIRTKSNVLWSLFLFAGYITYKNCTLTSGKYHCSLVIPNSEITILYKELLEEIFSESTEGGVALSMLKALQIGDCENFSTILQKFVRNSMSFYDFSSDEPEKSYHLFVLGMLVFFSDTYHVRSNRESGDGRYDLMMIPHDKTKAGIILEFKKARSSKNDVLEKVATEALGQVAENNYEQELRAQGIGTIFVYGIAFYGKKLLVKMKIT